MQPTPFSFDTVKRYAPSTVRLGGSIGLVVLDFYVLSLLDKATQETKHHSQSFEKNVLAISVVFACAVVATVAMLRETLQFNRSCRNLILSAEAETPLITPDNAEVEKTLWHDWIQTTLKLGIGAIGWQFLFLLIQFAMKDQYDPDFTNEAVWKTIIILLVTGLGTVIFLNAAMLIIQKCLAHTDNGTSASRLFALAIQLCVSVFIADGLWLLFTSSATLLSSHIYTQDCFRQPAEIVFAAALYLVESFVFKYSHNGLNHWHPNNDYHYKFHCDNQFVGILWGAYFGFEFCAEIMNLIIQAMTGWKPNQNFEPVNIIVSCVVAAIGTMIMPAIVGLGHYFEQKEAMMKESRVLSEVEENPLIIPEAFADANVTQSSMGNSSGATREDSFVKGRGEGVKVFISSLFVSACMASSKATNAMVDAVADLSITPDMHNS